MNMKNASLMLFVLCVACSHHNGGSPPKPDAPEGVDAAMVSCDGVQASDSSSHKVDILTYPVEMAVASCDPTSMASLSNMIGIVDQFSEKGGTVVEVVTPGGCHDVMGTDDRGGVTGAVWDGTCPAATTGCPTAFTTINALKASWPATAASETLVGVVEAVRPSSQGGGLLYLEDGGSCTTNCGLGVYVPKTVTTPLPMVGALVTATGMTGAFNGSRQLTVASFSVIGSTSYKLLPVASVSAQMVGPMAMTTAGPYEGMRVQVAGALGTSTTCPPELTYVSSGGGG
jgi:hypothetical protein